MNHQYLWICPRKLIQKYLWIKSMWQQGKQIRALDLGHTLYLICFLNDELHELETALEKIILRSPFEQRNDCVPKRTLKQNIQAMWTRCKHVQQIGTYKRTYSHTHKQKSAKSERVEEEKLPLYRWYCHCHSPKCSKPQWHDTLWLVAPLALANGYSLDL